MVTSFTSNGKQIPEGLQNAPMTYNSAPQFLEMQKLLDLQKQDTIQSLPTLQAMNVSVQKLLTVDMDLLPVSLKVGFFARDVVGGFKKLETIIKAKILNINLVVGNISKEILEPKNFVAQKVDEYTKINSQTLDKHNELVLRGQAIREKNERLKKAKNLKSHAIFLSDDEIN